MNVLFVIPKIYASYPGAMTPHLGVGYLISYIKNEGFDSKVIDMCLGYEDKDLIEVIKTFKPRLIGVTAYSFSFDKTKKLIETINRHKNCPLVIGGPHVSTFKKEVFSQVHVDFAVKGEGEYPLLELCKALQNGNKEYPGIKNLIWKDREKIVENEDAPLVENLDSLPFPDFESFELDKYIFSIDKRIPIATTRGCPYGCVFCSVKLSMGRSFRPRSPENVVEEIKGLYSKGWKYFDFVDDCFMMDIERAKKICDLIIEKGIKIDWSLGNGIRADRVDKELLQKMKKAGCVFLAYGLESGDDEILKIIKKGITVQKATETFELTKRVGIKFAVNFIIGHPTETYEKAIQTLKFAASIPACYVNVYNLIPYPHTELYGWIEKNGKFLVNKKDFLFSTATRVKEPVFETSDFTKEERIKALDKGFVLSKKTHLHCRFGALLAFLFWPVVRSEKIFYLGRRLALGSKIGRKLFIRLKKQ